MSQIDKLEADIKNIIAYSFRDDDMLVKSLCLYIGGRVKTAVENDINTKALYDELIMSVGMCFKNETRHQTALRYIKQAEERENDAEKSFGILNQESKK